MVFFVVLQVDIVVLTVVSGSFQLVLFCKLTLQVDIHTFCEVVSNHVKTPNTHQGLGERETDRAVNMDHRSS
ncbi:unnamed protein product [Lathyrus sativus]|nr:unnamed protein product [Lathyrus sativus]